MIPIQGDTRKKPDKDLRIRAMAGSFERSMFYFNEEEKDNHHMQRLIKGFLSFEPPKKTPKDGPDACEGAKFELEAMISGSGVVESGARKRNPKRY